MPDVKISGFTILRNGLKFDYPFIESIQSILPLIDEMIVAVGKSDDDTLGAVNSIKSQKIRIIETVWDDNNRKDGNEFARQTNIALRECKNPWAFYLQADEVLHEKDLELIRSEVNRYNSNSSIEAFSFKYIHFEANYDLYNPFRYKRAVRLVRNNPDIVSIKDAAEFGHENGKKLRIKKSDAFIYHYGWVKSPEVMLEKFKTFEKFWHDDSYVDKKYAGMEEFEFKMIEVSKPFKGSHPSVMLERIQNKNFRLPDNIPTKPLSFRKQTWKILLRKWGIIKGEWF
ncbi:MAG: glycosyltransferase family 2 protein [Acidobacteria bacterium]|nr:glycosyltransferase family 2 protein [Acidobacteriota bacterium]